VDRQRAYQLVQQYVDGWKTNDLPAILDSLSPTCLIVESHGPTYRGIEHIRRWAGAWFAQGRVDRWDITSFVFAGGSAAFEWRFECTVEGVHYAFDGASVARFSGDRIAALREYRMTQEPFEWEG
jgi:ketosteroid isomerase-like protein